MVKYTPINQEGYKLLHEGILALGRAEWEGLHIDTDYCIKEQERLTKVLFQVERNLLTNKEVRLWQKVYGNKFNLNNDYQLRHILYNRLHLRPTKESLKGTPSVDKSALENLNLPWTEKLVKYRTLKNARDTFLEGIIRETVDGVLHPFFNLNTVITFRSSSNNPNFHNIPTRLPNIRKIVRRAFIPRPGRQLLEVDYDSIEVHISSCYHKDPNMLLYLKDKKKDLHQDLAMECYLLERKQVTDDTRYSAKNGFVFPELYGDWYQDCAKSLWKNISTLSLVRKDNGINLKKHLKNKGIKNFDKFLSHIHTVEQNFWEEKFPVYNQWKKEWIQQYEQQGFMDTLTGFRCSGALKRNEVVNYPIQGSAFHCLLWSLIRLDKEMRKRKMKSIIVGQIHDSIIFDCVPEEIEELLILVHWVMCKELRKAWKWIIVPLDIKAELAPIDGSWYEKKKVEINRRGMV